MRCFYGGRDYEKTNLNKFEVQLEVRLHFYTG